MPSLFKTIKGNLRRVRRSIRALVDRDVYIVPTVALPIERHGSDYGGWVTLANSLDECSSVISAGLGQDISFDCSLIEKYKCKVTGYDPDLNAYAQHNKDSFPVGFEWRLQGVGAKNATMKLYRPPRPDWVSGTLVKGAIQHSQEFDLVEVIDVLEIMKRHHEGVDLFKMDIEGAEYEVIERLKNNELLGQIGQLLVEFHHGNKYKGSDTRRHVDMILRSGFELFWVSEVGHEFAFCQSRLCAKV